MKGEPFMTNRIASLVVSLLCVSTAFSSTSPRSIEAQNQFHFPSAPAHANNSRRLPLTKAQHATRSLPAQNSTRPTRPHPNLNPPISQIGFVTATQIPAGGAITHFTPALEGDFNGDGKKDVVTITQSSGHIYSVSVALGNGDGTFQTPKLTAVPGNVYDSFAVGDLNNDLKDDVVIIHRGPNASFDVMLSNGDGTFTVGSNYVITSGILAGGILYDSRNNGKLDMVAVDSGNPGTVWTLLGDGLGGFAAPTSVVLPGPAGGNLVFGDFNADGLLDFADNDFTTSRLTVYLATSATAFAPGVSYTTSDGVYDACSNAVGDLNGDGRPEIVSANCTDNNITIYVNNGDGTFKTPTVYYDAAIAPSTPSAAYVNSYALSIADVNGDGKADIVSTNYLAGDVTVLLGNGDGTVTSPNHGYATGGYPSTAPVVADFNGDGFPDIVVTDDTYSFVYMKGFGDGSFRAAVDYYSPTTDNLEAKGVDIATGDFNGDGFPDVVVANSTDATAGITVFLSNGDGTLKPGVNYGTGGHWNFVAVGDFNKDGIADIAALDVSTGTIQIYLGNASGTLTPGPTALTGDTNSQTLFAGDFNGDGYPDLAVANVTGQNIGVFINDGLNTGNFLTPVNYALSGVANQVTAAVLTSSGKLDLLGLQAGCGCVAVLLNNGNGTFGAEHDFSVANFGYRITTGDVNGDGFTDLVVTIQDPTLGHGIQVALGTGTGTFGTASAIYPSTLQPNFNGNPYPAHLVLTDLDGDGKLDAVYTNSNYGTIGVMYGVGNGTFFDPVEYPTGEGSYGLALADFNGDGVLDVVSANFSTSAATVLLSNNGSSDVLASSLNPAAVTQTITFTSTIAPNVRGVSTVPTGTVTFFDGATSLGTGTVTAGVATFSTTLAIGTHTITAHYGGDANFHASISTILNQAVTITPDSTTVLSSVNPAAVTQSITLSATVATSAAGVTTVPTGSVTFFDGTTSLGSGTVTAGVATLTTSSLAIGTHTITAQYAGDANFSGSTSTPFSQVVSLVPDTTTLHSSVNPAAVTQSITLTANVASSATGLTPVPTGSVTFFDGTTSLGPGTISAGVATLTTSSLAVGTHTITAQYGGDANFSGSTSAGLSQVVTVTPDYTVVPTPTSATVTAGGTGTYTVTLTPSNNYNGIVTFTCGTLPTKTTCTFAPPTLTPSGSTALTTTLTLKTTANSSALRASVGFDSHPNAPGLLASLSGVGIFGLLLAGSWGTRNKKAGRNKARRMGIILGAIALGMIVMLVGCGGGSTTTTPPPPSGGTTAGTYTVAVTATGTAGNNAGSTAAHTFNVTLIVQ
jgi:Bacterial Ig-like domain (group 3)/FG-GAP-like repeat